MSKNIVTMRSSCEPLYSDAIALFYDVDSNRFIDEDGFVVFDIFRLIHPRDVRLFKESKSYYSVRHRDHKDLLVELFYPTPDEWEAFNDEVKENFDEDLWFTDKFLTAEQKEYLKNDVIMTKKIHDVYLKTKGA